MSDYKCKAKYPGGPCVGYISKPHVAQDDWHYSDGLWFHPEEFPEFWEKVVEKDWEVQSLKFKFSDEQVLFATIQGNGKYAIAANRFYGIDYTGGSTLKACLDSGWGVVSVKRLSDGQIFTVGDKVDNVIRKNIEITKLTLSDDGKYLQVWGNFILGMNGWNHLNTITHSKKPLLITEDGVEIFEGDFYSFIYEDKVQTSIAMASAKYAKIDGYYFSTIDAACKYLEENKPQYSKKDLLSFSGYARGINDCETDNYCYDAWSKSCYNTKK